jgi:hypothetical protein
MAYVSALSIVVYAALGYQYALVALTIYWTTVPGTLITTWLLARRWRRAGIITPVEFLETRFSSAVRQIFVWSGIPWRKSVLRWDTTNRPHLWKCSEEFWARRQEHGSRHCNV